MTAFSDLQDDFQYLIEDEYPEIMDLVGDLEMIENPYFQDSADGKYLLGVELLQKYMPNELKWKVKEAVATVLHDYGASKREANLMADDTDINKYNGKTYLAFYGISNLELAEGLDIDV